MDNPETSYFILTLLSLGLLYLVKIIIFISLEAWNGFKFFIWARYGPQFDLKKKYGSWAVITGSTDGLGKQFALQLARRGMDIVLISNVKLESTAQEIKDLYNVKVKTIQIDFSSPDVYGKIRTELEGLDIGILVNNVGIANNVPEGIVEEDEEFYKKILNINVLSVLANTKIVIAGMIRKNRGLILNISSQTALMPCPYVGVYSSTKIFVKHISTILKSELSETNVQVKCLTPGFVKTNILSHVRHKMGFWENNFSILLPDPKTFVESAVAIFYANVHSSCGYWSHSLYMTILDALLSKSTLSIAIKALLLHIKNKKD